MLIAPGRVVGCLTVRLVGGLLVERVVRLVAVLLAMLLLTMLLVLMMVVRLLVVRLIGRTVLRGFSGPTVQLIVLLFVDQVVMQIVADPMARLSLLVEDLVKCFDFTRVAVRVVVLLLFFAVALALSPLALPGEQVGLPFLLDLLDLLLRDLDLLGQFDLFFGLRLEEGLGLVSRLVWVSFGLVSICFQFGFVWF